MVVRIRLLRRSKTVCTDEGKQLLYALLEVFDRRFETSALPAEERIFFCQLLVLLACYFLFVFLRLGDTFEVANPLPCFILGKVVAKRRVVFRLIHIRCCLVGNMPSRSV